MCVHVYILHAVCTCVCMYVCMLYTVCVLSYSLLMPLFMEVGGLCISVEAPHIVTVTFVPLPLTCYVSRSAAPRLQMRAQFVTWQLGSCDDPPPRA